MKQLTLKEISAYLPYGLKVLRPDLKTILEVKGLIPNLYIFQENNEETYGSIKTNTNKPILRNLSDLTKEIEHNGEKFVPIEWLEEKYYTLDLHKQCLRLLEEDGENWINQSDYMLVQHLIEWHFDIFNLKENNLCIYFDELNK